MVTAVPVAPSPTRSVSERQAHAPSRPASPAKSHHKSEITARVAHLLGARSPSPGRAPRLTPNQIRGFWAAWGGWALDGMDASIYAVVLVPALMELLPRSGIAPTGANIGYYGSILLALFLFGWG